MTKYITLLCLIVQLSGCTSKASDQLSEPISKGEGWTLTNLDIQVDITNPKEPKFKAKLDLQLTHADSSMGPTLVLNGMNSTMRFSKVESEGLFASMNAPGDGNRLLAKLHATEPFKKGDRLSAICSLEKIPNESLLFHWSDQFALCSWINAWYPTPIGQQDTAVWQSLKPPGRLEIKMPNGWSSICGGKKIVDEDGLEVYEFDGSVARSFAAGNYDVYSKSIDGKEMEIYSITSRSKKKGNIAKSFLKGLSVLESKFGAAPYEYKAIVEVPFDVNGFYGASEQQYILLKPQAFDDDLDAMPVLAHEAAHAWWATLVSVSFENKGAMWMSESMAQYSAYLVLEELYGEPVAKDFFKTGRGGFSRNHDAAAYFRMIRNGTDRQLISPADGSRELHYIADGKGAWVYHMLKKEMGDEQFFKAIQESIKRYANRSISLEQWTSVFNEFNNEPLDRFFEQWLEKTGAPFLQTDFRGKELTIRQSSNDPYWLSVELEVEYTDGQKEIVVKRVKNRIEQFEMKGNIKSVKLDPNDDLLIWKPIYGNLPQF